MAIIINLTHTEFEILAYLMQNKGIVITREQLIVKIWDYDFYGDEKTVNSHMRNLRAKLGSKGSCIGGLSRWRHWCCCNGNSHRHSGYRDCRNIDKNLIPTNKV